MPTLRHVLAANLSSLMESHEDLCSQPKLAVRTKIAQSHIGRILRMESDPTTDKIERLAQAFKISPERLLTRNLGKAAAFVEQPQARPYAATDPVRERIDDLLDQFDAEHLPLALAAIETALKTRDLLKPDRDQKNFLKRSVR